MDEAGPPPAMRWEVQPRLIFWSGVVAVGVVLFAAFFARPETDPPPVTVTVPTEPQRIGGMTSEDLENLRALLAVIARRDDLTPAEQRVVDMAQDIVDGVDDGSVGLTPSTAPAPPPPATQPPTTTTTTTTTQPPTTTTRPPVIDLNDLLDRLTDDPPAP